MGEEWGEGREGRRRETYQVFLTVRKSKRPVGRFFVAWLIYTAYIFLGSGVAMSESMVVRKKCAGGRSFGHKPRKGPRTHQCPCCGRMVAIDAKGNLVEHVVENMVAVGRPKLDEAALQASFEGGLKS